MSGNNLTDFIGHRKRMKQKYILGGLNNWMDYEVLEFLLYYSVQRRDTKPLAKKLIAKFKTLNAVFDADIKELVCVEGITEHSALLIKLFKDITTLYFKEAMSHKELLSSPTAVVNYLKTLLKGLPNEEFYVLFLNSANHLIAIENVHTGTVNKSVVYPRQIVERALYNHSAGVIIAHNHPSGSLKPSQDDCRTTSIIKTALNTVEITLLDHIIIADNNYFSWKENNML